MSLISVLTFAAAVVAVLLLLVLVWRARGGSSGEDLLSMLGDLRDDVREDTARGLERLERELRTEIAESARANRGEAGQQMLRFQQTLSTHLTSIATVQQQQLAQLSEANDRRLAEVRATLEQKLRDIEANNAAKLEEMRRTVDEKLHATLEQRLGESFKLVSDRLEQVHKGLGEMQNLAVGVGDLKKLLVNVKVRGGWGE
ncbi:MAG: DNA recombination protein RmuC, partial [Cupriavidus sp.]|nr:DNA recombination protein RmuC [Cupriavidus sp.]